MNEVAVAAVVAPLAFLGFWGWGLLAFLGFVMILCVYHEYAGRSFIALGATFGFIYLFLGWNVLGWTAHHWLESIVGFFAYFAAGAAWSVFKWNRLNARRAQKIREKTASYIKETLALLENPKATEWRKQLGFDREFNDNQKAILIASLKESKIPDDLLPNWTSVCANSYERSGQFGYYLNEEPNPFKYKSRLLTWIMFWWISAINYFFYDMIIDIVKRIWKRLVNVYIKITRHHFQDIDPRLLRRK